MDARRLPILFLLFLAGYSFSADISVRPLPVLSLTLNGTIDPITARYVDRGINRAKEDGAQLIVINLDTPGGLEVSMNQIVQAILASPIPVTVFVFPRGARAASAGVFIAMAAHISAMAPGTHIGAAHPVAGGGSDIEGTEGQKVENDATALLRSLAQMRGRSAVWAEEAVRQSVSLTDSEAISKKVVDMAAPDLQGLLSILDGRKVKMPSGGSVLSTAGAPVAKFDMNIIERFLGFLVNPDISYIFFVLGILGIIFEFSSPGIGAPGIAGGIAVLLALVGFGSLPTNLGGIAFIVLAVILFIIDIKVPSHGIWTAGGIASFVLGSFLLFPPWRAPTFPSAPEMRVSPITIAVMTALMTLFFVFIVTKGIAAQRKRISFGSEMLPGTVGEAVSTLDPAGQVHVGGEVWGARAEGGAIQKGETVEIVGRKGLELTVRRKVAP
jgi:membrane-bound serine protease (ClpP class)